MASPAAVPVSLQIGTTTAAIGHVELPIVSTPAGRHSAGLWQVDLHVDHTGFRRSLADLLRRAADELDRGAVDAG